MKIGKSKPIWIDLQVNGYKGIDFSFPDLTVEQVRTITQELYSVGTAGYCPTIVTCDPAVTERNLRIIAEACHRFGECGESILGVHLEGPFISKAAGAVGAHPMQWVRDPDFALFMRWQEMAEGKIRIVTIAAEAVGAVDFCRKVSAQGVVVSLGHQSAQTPEEIRPLAEAGAKAFTHLGNGIPGMVDRHRNVMWTALAEEQMMVMIIPDGHHLPKHLLKVLRKAVSLDRLIAVTDCSYPGGLPPGKYRVFGSDVVLEESGLLHNPIQHNLAGSTATMAQVMAVLQLPEVGFTPEECMVIGRENPLRMIARRTSI